MLLSSGTRLGPYEILSPLGAVQGHAALVAAKVNDIDEAFTPLRR